VTREPQLLRFADIEFDVKAGELRRAGVTTRLEPQPARVLALLVERAGDVVTRAELQQHVWSGDTFVDFERGLNYCIAQIRTALGDSATSPRFVETLPRRGYRFVAPVTVTPAPDTPVTITAEPPAMRRPDAIRHTRWQRVIIATTVAVFVLSVFGFVLAWSTVMRQVRSAASSPSVAVTPRPRPAPVRIAVALFDNDTKRPDYDQLAQTLTDAITARLAADPSRLTVIGNSPILRQVRSFRDVPVIGAKLGTGHVIVGQVQEIAGRLRVTAHLIRAADEGHVWARRFEPTEADMPTLDRTVADAVAGAVASKLLGQ
jgi:DNA-binding winged helix-turn-helix (wHTH) protein/TolB-like protein